MAVRPARLAVLIPDVNDWVHFAHRVMELFSQTWGGAGHIVLPCKPDGDVPAEFWRVLDAYDADYFGLYTPTNRDRQLADPEEFARWSEERARQMEQQGSHDPKGFLNSDDFLNEPLSAWSPHSGVATRLLRHLSPLRQLDEMHFLPLAADQASGWDLADMSVLPLPLSERYACLDTSGVDPLVSLMLLAVTGALGPSYTTQLEERGDHFDSHPVAETQVDPMLELCLRGHADPKQRETQRMIAEKSGNSCLPEPSWSSPELAEAFPLSKTRFACEWRQRHSLQGMRQPFVLVVGDTLGDFCLGMMLQRMTGRAAWVPASLVNDNGPHADAAKRKLACELRFSLRRNQRQTVPVITSLSVSPDHLEDLVRDLNRAFPGTASASEQLVQVVQVEEIPLPPPRRLLHKNLCNLPGYSPFVSTDMQAPIDTPIPRDCTGETAMGVTWWIDISVSGHLLPTRSCLNKIIVTGREGEHTAARCSKTGITYFSHAMLSWGGAQPHEAVERLRFRCPEAKEVFDHLLAQDGLTATLSSAGQFTLATLNLFGGLQEFADTILDKSRNAILNLFLSKEENSKETGVFLSSVRRRFLTFDVIKNTARLENVLARGLVDRWVDRGILARGLVLHCRLCSYAGWYALEELGSAYRCKRCRQQSPINRKAWKKPSDEPYWYYELAEVICQALSNNARAPILALASLRKKSKRAFLFTPELEVRSRHAPKTEIDLWAILDGQIVLGEANTTGRLDQAAHKERQKLQSLRRVADTVTADQVLFATTARDWDAKTRDRIADAFKGCRAKPEYLTGLGNQESAKT